MTDLPDALPADYEPTHVFRVVAMPLDRGWGVWLRAADDSVIHSFGIGLPPEMPFRPDVLEVLGPVLNLQFRLAYMDDSAWDELESHWSAVVYEYTPR